MQSLPMILDVVNRGVVENPLLAFGVFTVCCCIFNYRFTGETHKLKHIPTVGSEGPFLSLCSAIRFLLNAPNVIASGVKRWPDAAFKVPDVANWLLLVTSRQSIEEMRRAPDRVLSSEMAVDEMIQVKYTLGDNVSANPYHLPIIRTQLTRALPALVPEVFNEVRTTFDELIPVRDDWVKVKALDKAMLVVARASSRVFVGLPLCRNEEYLKLNIEFTMDVMKTGTLLRFTPVFLRPIMNKLVSNILTRVRTQVKYLAPLIRERREAKNQGLERPLDMLSWFMEEATEEESTDWNLARRILAINFAAVHTTSMTFVHTLYYLAAQPKYLELLRAEVDTVVKEEGWTKAALNRMVVVDSFIKESQRLRPLGTTTMQRVAVRDFTFADGTHVPAGTTLAVSTNSAHMSPSVYEDPGTFDPLRFVRMRHARPEKKYDLVTVNSDSLAFGYGTRACPGRFFVACELKLMLAWVATTYDVRLEKEGERPVDSWIGIACTPNASAEVIFRRRSVA